MNSLSQLAMLAASDVAFRSALASTPLRVLHERGLTLDAEETEVVLALRELLALSGPALLSQLNPSAGPDWNGGDLSLPDGLPREEFDAWLAEVDQHVAAALRESRQASHFRRDLDLIWEQTRATRAATTPLLLLSFLWCDLSGGNGRDTSAVAAAWSLLYLAARLQDDLVDHHDSPLVCQLGAARLSAVATGLTFAATTALLRVRQTTVLPDERVLALQAAFARAAMQVCVGQHYDLSAHDLTVPDNWRQAAGKTAPALGLLCWAGGVVAGAGEAHCARLSEFGHLFGLMLQLLDDLKDFGQAEDDLSAGRPSLLVQFAAQAGDSPWQACLREVVARAPHDAVASDEARRLVLALGGLHRWLLTMERCRRTLRAELVALVSHDSPADTVAALLALVDWLAPWRLVPVSSAGPCARR